MAGFFFIHYGGFHLVYLIFLFALFPIGVSDFKAVIVLGFLFFVNHLVSYVVNYRQDQKNKKTMAHTMMLPYVRIIPMHAIVVIGSVVGGGVVFFLILKTITDILSHEVEHRLMAILDPKSSTFEADFKRAIHLRFKMMGVVMALMVAGGYWWAQNSEPVVENITSYEQCAEAGYPIMESYPEQCQGPDGQTFVREIDEVEADPLTRSVSLYFYNPELDTDAEGNIICSEAGLVAVLRDIPQTQTPIQDVVNLLLQGEVSAAEKAQGIETEYPLAGLKLVGAKNEAGRLTLEFSDPNGATSGGSCRTNILWQQIRETARQFPEVTDVQFQPEELFQP
ncbi:MAG: DUF6498-containing protein, partial [Candidatus Paceibacterota bacterium]